MSEKFQVATGIVTFRQIEASSPREAIYLVKLMIDARRHTPNPDIGMSLVESLDAGTLNFIVFDEHHAEVLAGEYKGEYQFPVSPELAQAMSNRLSPNHVAGLEAFRERHRKAHSELPRGDEWLY